MYSPLSRRNVDTIPLISTLSCILTILSSHLCFQISCLTENPVESSNPLVYFENEVVTSCTTAMTGFAVIRRKSKWSGHSIKRRTFFNNGQLTVGRLSKWQGNQDTERNANKYLQDLYSFTLMIIFEECFWDQQRFFLGFLFLLLHKLPPSSHCCWTRDKLSCLFAFILSSLHFAYLQWENTHVVQDAVQDWVEGQNSVHGSVFMDEILHSNLCLLRALAYFISTMNLDIFSR